jgi:hypothetical protein
MSTARCPQLGVGDPALRDVLVFAFPRPAELLECGRDTAVDAGSKQGSLGLCQLPTPTLQEGFDAAIHLCPPHDGFDTWIDVVCHVDIHCSLTRPDSPEAASLTLSRWPNPR